MGSSHDLLPGLVDLIKSFGLLRQLLGNIPTHEDRLQVDPEVLDQKPTLENLTRVREIFDPLLYLFLKRRVEPVGEEGAEDHQTVLRLAHSLGRGVSPQQEFSSVLEHLRPEWTTLIGPQLSRYYALIGWIFCYKDTAQLKASSRGLLDAMPAAMASMHGKDLLRRQQCNYSTGN